MLKKTGAIAVLFIFLLNTMGYFVIFKYNQFFLKREMFREIRSGVFHSQIVLLKITDPDKNRNFRRIDRGEFSYYGKLFDVIVERKSGNTTSFYCLHDKKEENLMVNFATFLRRGNRPGHSSKNIPNQALLHHLITQALVESPMNSNPSSGHKIHFQELRTRILQPYLFHVAPPPEIA